MSRYIEADKLQEEFKELHGGKRSLLIDTQPTADVRENIHGTWLKKTYKGTFFVDSMCSNCGKAYSLYPLNYNYCPNCGARMDERREDDTDTETN